MTFFQFWINKSFLEYPSHPITIPKSQIDYDKLREFHLDSGNYTILFPRGEKVNGFMYHGIAGYGQYYQLRFNRDQILPQYIYNGGKLLVVLLCRSSLRYAILESID